METVTDFILGDSKITADGDCSHEIKRCILLGRKGMTNLDSILKSRDITLPTKVHLVKAMVFPVVTCGCDSWTIKKSACRRIDAFELWCWRRCLRVPWTARWSNQSILKEISPHWKDWCWSWNANTLATWCKELTHLKRPWGWERLRAGEGDDRGGDGWMASPPRWTWVWASLESWWWTGKPGVLQSMGPQGVRHDWATELNCPCHISGAVWYPCDITGGVNVHCVVEVAFDKFLCCEVFPFPYSLLWKQGTKYVTHSGEKLSSTSWREVVVSLPLILTMALLLSFLTIILSFNRVCCNFFCVMFSCSFHSIHMVLV